MLQLSELTLAYSFVRAASFGGRDTIIEDKSQMVRFIVLEYKSCSSWHADEIREHVPTFSDFMCGRIWNLTQFAAFCRPFFFSRLYLVQIFPLYAKVAWSERVGFCRRFKFGTQRYYFDVFPSNSDSVLSAHVSHGPRVLAVHRGVRVLYMRPIYLPFIVLNTNFFELFSGF